MMKTAKQLHDEKVRQDIFNVVAQFTALSSGLAAPKPHRAGVDAMMRNIDELCCFTPDESEQARDYIFNSSDDGTVPNSVMIDVIKCSNKLGEVFKRFTGGREDYAAMWETLYDLFEIDSLWEAAKENGAGREE